MIFHLTTHDTISIFLVFLSAARLCLQQHYKQLFLNFSCIICNAITVLCIAHFVLSQHFTMENKLCDLFSTLEACFQKAGLQSGKQTTYLLSIVKCCEKTKWTIHKTVIAVQIIHKKSRKIILPAKMFQLLHG